MRLWLPTLPRKKRQTPASRDKTSTAEGNLEKMIMTKCMKNTNDMKEEEGSTAGEITGMKAKTDIGKKK